MPDFRRPPEWDQRADRHTQLTDPVLTVRQLGRFEYAARKALTRIDNALVFVNGKGAHDAFLPPHRPSRAELATGRYTAVYEVDTGIHQLAMELALPSDDDAFEFAAAADLTWQVKDPAAFVTSGERDVPALLARRLRQLARPVTRHPPSTDPARGTGPPGSAGRRRRTRGGRRRTAGDLRRCACGSTTRPSPTTRNCARCATPRSSWPPPTPCG